MKKHSLWNHHFFLKLTNIFCGPQMFCYLVMGLRVQSGSPSPSLLYILLFTQTDVILVLCVLSKHFYTAIFFKLPAYRSTYQSQVLIFNSPKNNLQRDLILVFNFDQTSLGQDNVTSNTNMSQSHKTMELERPLKIYMSI